MRSKAIYHPTFSTPKSPFPTNSPALQPTKPVYRSTVVSCLQNLPQDSFHVRTFQQFVSLYYAYLNDPLIYLADPRGSDAYAPSSTLRKSNLGLDSMKKVIHSLSTLGYLEDHGGFHDRTTGIGYLFRMRATPTLFH